MSHTADGPVRIAVAQLDKYGPWTVTPTPRRETDLQSLQARLYADFADFVGRDDGYAFFDRFDNMLAVVNKVSLADFSRFQERVNNRYPVTASIAVGSGPTPLIAVDRASQLLQDAGSAQAADRQEVLRCDQSLTDIDTPQVTIGHFDIIDVTDSYTDRQNALDTSIAVQQSILELKTYLRDEHDSLVHFVGGDNAIAVCPGLSFDSFAAAIDHLEAETGVQYRVGIGRGQTAHAAGDDAKHALEICRETGTRIEECDSGHRVDQPPTQEYAHD